LFRSSEGMREGRSSGAMANLASKRRVFVDATTMKEELKKNIFKPRYDVTEYYKSDGLCQHIARHHMFEAITLAVIAGNAIWIAIDIDWNTADILSEAQPVFIVAENVFAVFFSFELGIRFGAFQSKRNCLRDAWFVFDALMVAVMGFETWIVALILASVGGGKVLGLGNATLVRMLRLLRVSRVARMARLLRCMPEIIILIKGMVAAMRSVFFTLVLLVALLYIFGILFKQLSIGTNTGDTYFSTVPRSMNQLIVHGIFFDDFGNLVGSIVDEDQTATAVFLLFFFYLFVLLATLTVMNTLIGVLCEVVSAVAETEHEELAISYVKDNLWTFVKDLAEEDDTDVTITKKDFLGIVQDRNVVRMLKVVEVDLFAIIDIVDAIFVAEGSDEERTLTFPEFIEVLLEHRSTADATVKDITDLRKFIRQRAERTDTELGHKIKVVGAHIQAMGEAIARIAIAQESGAQDEQGAAPELHAAAAPRGASPAPMGTDSSADDILESRGIYVEAQATTQVTTKPSRSKVRSRPPAKKLSLLSDPGEGSQSGCDRSRTLDC